MREYYKSLLLGFTFLILGIVLVELKPTDWSNIAGIVLLVGSGGMFVFALIERHFYE